MRNSFLKTIYKIFRVLNTGQLDQLSQLQHQQLQQQQLQQQAVNNTLDPSQGNIGKKCFALHKQSLLFRIIFGRDLIQNVKFSCQFSVL